MSKIVIALGGNALGKSPYEQKEKVKKAASSICDFIEQGHDVIISHGNGPQVGMIKLGLDTAADLDSNIAHFPLPECTALSQGYIGYHLQNEISRELFARKINKGVVTLVTQIEVSPEDPAFSNPTKPIGAFYTQEEAYRLMAENPAAVYKEDAGRDWRLTVASPKPVNILEKDSINTLLNSGFVVIACGGGGIPVIKKAPGVYEGADAVIDKDFASAKLAAEADADFLYIITAVDRVILNYGKPNAKELIKLSSEEAQGYAREGHFAPGSMLPKVMAAIDFVSGRQGRSAVISSLEKAGQAAQGLSGTVITG